MRNGPSPTGPTGALPSLSVSPELTILRTPSRSLCSNHTGLLAQTGPVPTSGLCTGSSLYLLKTVVQRPLLGAADADHPVKIGPHFSPTSFESLFLVLFLLLTTRITIKYIIDSLSKFIVDLSRWNGSPWKHTPLCFIPCCIPSSWNGARPW